MNKINQNHILFIIFAGLSLRIIIALINSFLFPTPGGEADAIGFNFTAYHFAITGDKEIHNITRVGWTYSLVLGYIYKYLFNSLFFGCLLSVLAWLISAIFILKALNLLGFKEEIKFYAMLIFSFLPTSIFYTSITLREPFQLLFLTLMLYSMIRFYLTKSILHLLLIPLWCIALGSLHNALNGISLAALGLFVAFFSLSGVSKKVTKVRFYFVLIIFISIIPIFFGTFQEGYTLDYGLTSAVTIYQEGLIGDAGNSRALYRVAPVDGSLGSFLIFLPTAFFQYQLEPLPWRIGSIMDILFTIENFIRASLIVLAAFYLKNTKGTLETKKRSCLLFIFSIYLLTEFMWALGTINWGTASRHHIPSLGLLALVAAPALASSRFSFFILKSNKPASNL